jgi:hypothetical protein
MFFVVYGASAFLSLLPGVFQLDGELLVRGGRSREIGFHNDHDKRFANLYRSIKGTCAKPHICPVSTIRT